jgi:hypothetical protein
MTGETERAVKAWLATYAATWAAMDPTWVPRVLTGYERMTAGAALGEMEEGGEPDTIIVECNQASPVTPTAYSAFAADVVLRIRHDCDRVDYETHRERVHAAALVIHDDDAATNLSAMTHFTAQLVIPGTQTKTSTGRSFETSLAFQVKGFARSL